MKTRDHGHAMFCAAALAFGLAVPPAHAQGGSAPGKAALERGALLVGIGGCADCHTPFRMGPKGPEKDKARGLSGHPESFRVPPPPALNEAWNWAGVATMTAFAGPWGITYASNITPDRETGIGQWKEGDFVQAMRTGRHMGVGRPILPPMPWEAVGALPDADLKAVFAYLMSLPPVKNRVPAYAPPATAAK